MPQVIIHIPETVNQGAKAALVRRVRESIHEVLHLDTLIGQVILYESPVSQRGIHDQRDPHFVFVEAFMYPGRKAAVKKELMERIVILINRYLDVSPRDIHAVIHEIPRENYYGGMMHRH